MSTEHHLTALSIVIPIYNEEGNIAHLYKRLVVVLREMGLSYEIIFVNDGSADQSIQLIQALSLSDDKVKYIDLSRNFGHQIAVSAGLDFASGNTVVIIDADLQDPPELIATLYQKWQEGYEVVYATRNKRKGESALKLFTARVFYRLMRMLTSIDIPVDTGDFRLIDRKVVEALKNMPEKNKFLRGQIAWIGFNQCSVQYDRDERQYGKTGYTYRKMMRLAIDGITAFSDIPLKLVTVFGFLVSGMSFLVMLYALYSKYIKEDFVKGWPSTILSILFIGGIQLIGIGIIGEYISRINNNVRNRPLYLIKKSNLKS